MQRKTLNVLIGETITSVEANVKCHNGVDDLVDEVYRVTTESGKIFYFASDGGTHPHFCKIREIKEEDIEDDELQREFVPMGKTDFIGVWVDPQEDEDGGHRILL